MTARQITQLFVNLTQIVNLTRSVSIHKQAVEIHTATMNQVRTKLDKFREQYGNQEYMKTLSPAESQNLTKNANAFYGTYQTLVKELEYLEMSGHPTFIINATQELDKAYLLIEWLLSEVGKTGETILPHLTCIKAKFFADNKYKTQIESLAAEMDAISHDFYVDYVQGNVEQLEPMLVPICDHLFLASCWLAKENERLLTEALPEIKKIEMPVETVPEIPAGPVSDVEGPEAKVE